MGGGHLENVNNTARNKKTPQAAQNFPLSIRPRWPAVPAEPGLRSTGLEPSPPTSRALRLYSRPTLVVVHAHGAVALVVGHSSTVGTVHRNLEVVGPQAMAVSVRIGKQATLRRCTRKTSGAVAYETGNVPQTSF